MGEVEPTLGLHEGPSEHRSGAGDDVVADDHTFGTKRAILDAAGVCLARWGVTKTTIADLAGEAGCSRATVYRSFPGGKSQIMTTYAMVELQGFFGALSDGLAEADTLEDALVGLVTTASRALADHAGFQFMLTHEPGVVLPYLGFANIDRLYALVTASLSGGLERFVGDRAPHLVELAARFTLSHIFQPDEGLDLCDTDDARTYVRRHLLPVTDLPATDVAAAATAAGRATRAGRRRAVSATAPTIDSSPSVAVPA